VRSDDGPELFARVLANAASLRDGLRQRGFKVIEHEVTTPIVPVLVEDDWKAALLWKALYEAGVYVNVAVHPAVPPRGALRRPRMARADRAAHARTTDECRLPERGGRGEDT